MNYPQRNKLETTAPGTQLQAALGPALRRVRLLSLAEWLGRGPLAGLGLTVLFLIIARFWPWYSIAAWCLAALGISLLLALIPAVLYRPGWYSAAVWLDEAGLRERAVTALENINNDSEISRTQRQDCLRQIRAFRVEEQPYPRPLRQTAALGMLSVLVLTLFLIPNPQQEVAEREQTVRREAAAQSRKVEAVRKKMEQANKAQPLPEREKTIQALKELERQLEHARNLNGSLKAIAKTEEELQKLQASDANPDAQKLAQALQKQALTRALGQKLAAGDAKGSREEIQRMLKMAAAMSKEQREAAANQLAAQTGGLNPAEAGLIKSLAASIRQGQGAPSTAMLNQAASSAMQNAAASSIAQGITSASSCRQGLLAAGGNGPANQLANGVSSGNVQAVMPGGGSEANSGGEQPGAGIGSGTGKGNGSGQGQGTSNGVGSGAGSGGGAGHGTGSGSDNRSGEAKPGSGVQPSGEARLSIGQYEKVFIPSLINSSGESSQIRGHAGEGPEESVDTNEPLPGQGSQLPYNEVVGAYSQRAREALDRSSIPPGMSEIVKGYFSSLEE